VGAEPGTGDHSPWLLLVSKLRQLGLKRTSRALGLRPLDALPLKLFSGLRQSIPGRLPLVLDPRQLRFEPSDLLAHLGPMPLLLGPLPLEHLALRLMDAIGRLPRLSPHVSDEVKDRLGDRRHRGQDGLGPLFSPLGEHGPDGRVAAAADFTSARIAKTMKWSAASVAGSRS
jgi:hypothetical protein